MKFTGFTSSIIGKFFLILLCILLGVVLAIGGEALAGYIVLTKEGMVGTISDRVEDSLGDSNLKIQFDDETKAMSLLEWGTELVGSFGNMSDTTIGDIEKLIGLNILSATVEDVIGVQADKVQESKIGDLGSTISNNLTLNNAKTNFGISFPDMPLFNNEDFLNKPLATAFEGFNDYTLADVIEIKDDANAVLKELKDTKINDLGGGTTDSKIKEMFLCQIMTINDDSAKTLKALKYSSIESFYEYEADGTTIKTDELGNKVYRTKEYTETIDGVAVTKAYPLKGINDTIDDLLIKDVVDISETSSAVLRKMRTPTEEEVAAGKADKFGTEDLKVKELGGTKVTDIIDNTKIGEIVTITETSEPIMIALQDTMIKGLNDKIKVLKLNEIFKASDLSSGALSLIDPETTLTNIPAAMTDVMLNATTATLRGKGLIAEENFASVGTMRYDQQAFIFNNSIGGMLQGMINFMATPMIEVTPGVYVANYGTVSPRQTTISTASFASLKAFVAAYNQFDAVDFDGNLAISITVDATEDAEFYSDDLEKYVIPVFCIRDKNAVVITVSGGDVGLGVFDKTSNDDEKIADGESVKYKGLTRHQYAYYYVSTTVIGAIDPAYGTITKDTATNLTKF